MSDDPNPTPSGMPAAALIEETRTSNGDVERAAIVGVVREAMREELRGVEVRFGERFQRLEGEVLKVDERVTDLDAKLVKHAGEQASALTDVAKAAATAANLALEAKKKASEADENAKTIVESALRIHASSIAVTVDDSVKKAMAPVVERFDAAQANTNEAVGAIVEELGIEDRVKLGREVKPGEKRPERALARLDRRAKSSTIVQVIIALSVIASLIERLLQHH